MTGEKQRDGDDGWYFTLDVQLVDLGEQYPDGSLVLVGASEKAVTQAKEPRRGKDTPARRSRHTGEGVHGGGQVGASD